MRSSEGETYDLRNPVTTDGPIEVWIKAVEAEMRYSLYQIAKGGVFYYAKAERSEWILNNLGMVTLVSFQFQCTSRCFAVLLLCFIDNLANDLSLTKELH
jgi:dynein heavy chain